MPSTAEEVPPGAPTVLRAGPALPGREVGRQAVVCVGRRAGRQALCGGAGRLAVAPPVPSAPRNAETVWLASRAWHDAGGGAMCTSGPTCRGHVHHTMFVHKLLRQLDEAACGRWAGRHGSVDDRVGGWVGGSGGHLTHHCMPVGSAGPERTHRLTAHACLSHVQPYTLPHPPSRPAHACVGGRRGLAVRHVHQVALVLQHAARWAGGAGVGVGGGGRSATVQRVALRRAGWLAGWIGGWGRRSDVPGACSIAERRALAS